ncbi:MULTISPECIES: LysR family transcriptional regulator [Lysobacter]|uniref:LysR family transcriptional regulator n=1 Tax=Lysobacter gummosus TaxID=262324 RepID=A0ABY3XJE6_9GAMM|nr:MULTISPECIES: LysR family transcriptional regulator [Lysobacter]ALN91370.1 bacterial regulatory helix-turn-helix, lysR family protein [Lysobacter gummosus]UJB21572.1 LysR family transcriptional regulator [Lysobacter capsici]UJQ29311.1 LysR family transcriptional regulator [Lysobacter gummosus]UNP31751.1 LysR family transcriptional regulator [Lysobacter gummosus]
MNQIHSRTDQLDLNLLKVFEAVHREQNLSRAAQSLYLTPSAVSHALTRLRQHFGDPLFVRDGRRMSPTPSCQRIAPQLIDTLTRLRELLQHWDRFDPAHTRQAFRVGMPDATESALLPALAQTLHAHAPGATLASVAVARRELGRELAAGQVDLAVDVALPISEPVRHRPLFQDGFCVVMREGHALSKRLSLKQYLQARHVAVSTRASGQVIEDIALLNLGLQRVIALRCQNYHSACEVVAQSDALLTMPAGLAGRIAANAHLRRVAVPFALPAAQLHLYWHANSEFEPANRWLREVVIGVCERGLFG